MSPKLMTFDAKKTSKQPLKYIMRNINMSPQLMTFDAKGNSIPPD